MKSINIVCISIKIFYRNFEDLENNKLCKDVEKDLE